MKYISKAAEWVKNRYFSDLPSGMENFGDDVRYVILPVALGAFVKSALDSNVPDYMVTESLGNPAYVFGAAEFMRSAGTCARELRDGTLTIPKAVGACIRAGAPVYLGIATGNGSHSIREAISDTFPYMVMWGLGHKTIGKKSESEALKAAKTRLQGMSPAYISGLRERKASEILAMPRDDFIDDAAYMEIQKKRR